MTFAPSPTAPAAAALLLSLVASSALADPVVEYRSLRQVLAEARAAASDPDRAAAWVTAATGHAQNLATESCASNFQVSGVHGVNLAIWGLMRVGNAALHRHGAASQGRLALTAAREILLSASASCLSGPEVVSATTGMDAALAAAGDLDEIVPASHPDLNGAPAATNTHCTDESPPEGQLKTRARNWAQNVGMPPAHELQAGSGVVTCDPTDPEYIWRVTFDIRETYPRGPYFPFLVYVHWEAWQCGTSSSPGSPCE